MDPKAWAAVGLYVLILYAMLGFARDIVDFLRANHMLVVTILTLASIFSVSIAIALWKTEIWRSPVRLMGIAVTFILAGGFATTLDAWEERIHLVQYAVLALLIGRALWNLKPGSSKFIAIFMLTSLFGAIDEGIQYFLPTRYFDIRDIAFNSAGALWGTLLIAFLSAKDHKRHES